MNLDLKVDLSVDLAGIALRNPVITASGTLGPTNATITCATNCVASRSSR